MKNRLVIDVTQLVGWKGRLTGVPRVMNEISMRFAKNSEIVFIAWDGVEQSFSKVDLEEALAQREQQLVAEKSAEQPQVTGLQRKVIEKLKYVRTKSTAAKALTHYPVKIGKKLANKSKTPTPAAWAQKHKTFPLKNTDTLMLLWGDWGDEAYIQKIGSEHKKGVKLIQLVYDMLPVVTPQYSGHSTKSLTRFSLEIYPRCSLLLSISEHTKHDLDEWLKRNHKTVPPIEVIRLGDDFNFAKAKKPTGTETIKSGDYILCVGTIEARKNHTLLYYVYKRAKQQGIKLPKLVVVGRRGWQTDDIYELIKNDPETSEQFVILENCDDNGLSWLYENCKFSVYPSFYEGWGLPIAESIARGVPCACSNTSSMPEVVGELATYFSPSSTDECLAALQKLQDPKELNAARKKALQYKTTTWDQSFEQIHDIIKKAL